MHRLDEEDEEDVYLQPEWEINPHDIFFCSRANGKLCRLGKGAFGTVSLDTLCCKTRACGLPVLLYA